MRRYFRTALLPAAVAISMSVGIFMTASAQTTDNDLSSDATSALEAVVPGLAVLEHLVAAGILPPQAAEAIVRVRLEQAEWTTPGAICRRVADAEDAPASLIERCRTANQDSETISPAAACRRVAAADSPVESLVARCRLWLASVTDSPARFEVCRRIANAESVDASLVERCRALLADDTTRPERPERPEQPTERPTRPATSTVR